MTDDRLLRYVQDALVQGYDERTILEHLVKAGWNQADIEAALATAQLAPGFGFKIKQLQTGKTQEELDVPELGFFRKLWYILFRPRIFFSNISEEKGIFRAMFFYLTLLFVFCTFTTSIYYLAEEYYLGAFDYVQLAGLIFISMVISFFGIILFCLIVNLFVSLFGGGRDFLGTLRIVYYAAAPALVLSFVPFGNFLGVVWAMALGIYGVSKNRNITFGRSLAAFVVMIICLLLALTLIIWLLRALSLYYLGI